MATEDRADGDVPVFGSNGAVGWHDRANTDGPVIVVGRKGSHGKLNYSPGPVFAIDTTFVVDAHVTRTHLRWLHYALSTLRLDELSADVGVPGLSRDRVYEQVLPLPTRIEQRAIADFLDAETARIDALIHSEKCRAERARERLASESESLVLGSERRRPTVNAEMGPVLPVPMTWETRRNKTFLREVLDLSITGDEELLTVSHITGVSPRAEKDVPMFLAEDNVGYKRVQPGDLVVNTMWAWMGALGVATRHGIVSPAYGVYRFTDKTADSGYFDAMFRTPAYVSEMTRYSKGVWTSRLRLYPESFLTIASPFPPPGVQREIAAHLRDRRAEVSRIVDLLDRSVSLLRERRQALITAAVTGELPIPGAAA